MSNLSAGKRKKRCLRLSGERDPVDPMHAIGGKGKKEEIVSGFAAGQDDFRKKEKLLLRKKSRSHCAMTTDQGGGGGGGRKDNSYSNTIIFNTANGGERERKKLFRFVCLQVMKAGLSCSLEKGGEDWPLHMHY